MDNAKKGYDQVLAKFFGSYLFLRNNEEVEAKVAFPQINKVYLNNLRRYYELKEREEDSEYESGDSEEYDPF